MTQTELFELDKQQALAIRCTRALRLRIAEGDGGTGLVWDVVWGGIHLATLTGGIDLGNDRTSFAVVPATSSAAQIAMLQLDNFWMQLCIEFREHDSGMVAIDAKILSVAARTGRIYLSGLSFAYRLSFLDCIFLFFRSFRPKRAATVPPAPS